MKLLPILEPGDKPRKATWYSLIPSGKSPCARVGHSCSYITPVGDAKSGKVVIVGGANPSQSFSDAHILDLGTHQWNETTRDGLLPRYEHASFTPACTPHSIWVFGGADQSGNRNCLQVLNPGSYLGSTHAADTHVAFCTLNAALLQKAELLRREIILEAKTWTTPEVTCPSPSPRTFHTSSAAIGNQLYVFGGGERGADPVQDVRLHVFDANTLTWSQPETLENPPSPRHGHVMVAAGTKLFIHGGLAGAKFFNDLYCIDISDMKWQKLSPTGVVPEGCAAHSAVAVKKHVYVFGGMSQTGALNTMYQYHIEKQHWTLLHFSTFLPPGRLDHSMCIIPWSVTSTSNNQDSSSITVRSDAEKGDSTDKQVIQGGDSCKDGHSDTLLCFVFGGMNTEGEIFDDCIVTVVD